MPAYAKVVAITIPTAIHVLPVIKFNMYGNPTIGTVIGATINAIHLRIMNPVENCGDMAIRSFIIARKLECRLSGDEFM